MPLSLTKFFLKYWFRQSEDIVVPFGPLNQKGALFAAIYTQPLWERTPFYKKLISVFTFKWNPENDLVLDEAKRVLMKDVFGDESDFGEVLFQVNLWHSHQQWNFDHLTDNDRKRADALQSTQLLTALRHSKEGSNEYLHLQLAEYNPLMCGLLIPLILKVPVRSIRFTKKSASRKPEHPFSL